MMGFETGDEGAAMDVVEGFREDPLVFCIVDLETAVWGDTTERG